LKKKQNILYYLKRIRVISSNELYSNKGEKTYVSYFN
jgi:hypothetical protein